MVAEMMAVLEEERGVKFKPGVQDRLLAYAETVVATVADCPAAALLASRSIDNELNIYISPMPRPWCVSHTLPPPFCCT